jgi:hypothetical protein
VSALPTKPKILPGAPSGTTPVGAVVIPPEAPSSASADSLLVPIETSVGNPEFQPPERVCHRLYPPPATLPAPSFYQDWVHAGWHRKRGCIYESLIRTSQTPARIWAFAGCCGVAHLEERDAQANGICEYRIRSSRCHDRLCDPCSSVRAWEIQRALHERMTKVAKPMLITLTLISKPSEALAAKIDELYKCFRYLRDHPLWKAKVRGGAAFLEITRGLKGDRWHAHFHIVADSEFLDFYALQAVWKTITKGAFRVRVERPKEENGVAYSSKYASKGVDFSVLETPELLDEVVLALKGRRLVFCFGDWFGTSFAADIEEDRLDGEETVSGSWRTVCTLQTAAAAALDGNARFAAAIRRTRIAGWFNAARPPPP